MREAIIKFWPEAAGAKPQMADFASDATDRRAGEAAATRSHRAHRPTIPASPRARPSPTIFETVAEEHLIQPTFIYDFPLAVSPLSKKSRDEPDWVERFEFYVGGLEMAMPSAN